MNHTDESTDALETDGGPPVDADIFTRRAEVEDRSRVDYGKRMVDAYLYTPLSVAAEDVRTVIGGVILLLFVLTSTVGVWLIDAPRTMEGPIFLPPFRSWEYPLGTGGLGKDLFAQIVHSSPAMLVMILTGAILSVAIGTAIGTIAGYRGGQTDKVLMGFTDVVLTIPSLALVIVLAAVYQPEKAWVVGFILGIDNWPRLARTVRSQVLSIREDAFTEASRIMGISETTILRKDIVSNLMPYISVNFADSSRRIIFESVALYFLHILPFTSKNWGVMLNEAYENISLTDPSRLYVIVEPMLVIMIVSLGFILFAQGLDRVFNVRLRARHAKTTGGDDETTE